MHRELYSNIISSIDIRRVKSLGRIMAFLPEVEGDDLSGE